MNGNESSSDILKNKIQDAADSGNNQDCPSVIKEKVRLARVEFLNRMERHAEIFGCYMIFNREGVIQYLNLNGLDTFGIESLKERRRRLGAYIVENDREVFERFLFRVFSNGTKEHCELQIKVSADRTLWVRLDGKASNDGDACHAVLFDITERKLAEEYLSANEVKFRALFSNMSTAFSYHKLIRDKQGNGCQPILMEANEAYGMLLGVPVNKIIGQNCLEINAMVCAPTLDWERLCNDVVVQRQPACFDYYDKRLKRWLSIIAYSPAPEHMALVYVDITRTKNDEQLVSESEQRYRNLVQGTDVVIMIVNSQAKITFINEYGLEFFGYSEGELVSRSIFDTIVPIYEGASRDSRESLDDFLSKSGQLRRNVKEIITRSGRRVWVDWTSHELIDPKSGDPSIICVGVDVSDSKRNEQEALLRHKLKRQKDLMSEAIQRNLGFADCVSSARQLGINIQEPAVLILIKHSAEGTTGAGAEVFPLECQKALDNLIAILHITGAGLAWHAPDGIGLLRPLPDNAGSSSSLQAGSITADIMKILTRYWSGPELRVGISRASVQTQNIGEMYEQASSAIAFGPLLHPERLVHHWHDLGCYQFVLNDLGSEQSQHFVRENLGPLLESGSSEENGELLDTLRELLTGDSAQVISKKLHIHPQTVAFRKKKIEKLLNVDLDSMEIRLKLTIATRLLAFMEKNVRMAHLVV